LYGNKSGSAFTGDLELSNLSLFEVPYVLSDSIICLDSFINIPTSVSYDESNQVGQFEFSPNPFTTETFLRSDESEFTSEQIILYDVWGKIKMRTKIILSLKKLRELIFHRVFIFIRSLMAIAY
jgi:hypothetical protein